MASVIARLAVTLGMDTTAFSVGARKAQAQSQQLEGGLGKIKGAAGIAAGALAGIGAGIVIGAFQSAVSGAFAMASALSEAAEQTGLTVEGLQELRFAAEQSGVSADQMESAMKRLNKSLGDLQLGETEAVEAFTALGLSADELRGKRPDEALRLIADALNKLPDPAMRVAIGQDLMGRSFSNLLPLINGGSAALEEFAQKSRENGQVSTEDAARLDELADSWEALKTRVGVATATLIANVAAMSDRVGAFFDGINQFAARFDAGMARAFNNALASVRGFVNGVGEWITGTLGRIWDAAMAKIDRVEAKFRWLLDKVITHSWIPDLVDGIEAEFSRLSSVLVDPAVSAAVTVERTFHDMAEATLQSFSRLTNSIKSGGFLGILESVLGFGLQLGSVGLFGKTVAARINAPSGNPSGYISPPKASSGGSGGTNITVTPSPYFDVAVNGQIVKAAPAIVSRARAETIRSLHRQSLG